MADEQPILESWKEIAAYLKRSVRTCQDSERSRGLPVHRLDDSAKARVFAYRAEIDAWLAERIDKRAAGKNRRLLFALAAMIILLAVLVLVVVLGGKFRGDVRPSPLLPKSVAVLPFVDLSPDKGWEFLAEGLSEELINALSRLGSLRVSGRISALAFKDRKADVREIGEKLGVEAILEGSVSVIGDRLRVTAQLVSSRDGFQLWSGRYDRTTEDIFSVQDNITRAIIDTLKVRILGVKSKPIVKFKTTSLHAYNLYLQGRYLWNKRGKENLLKSIEFCEKAIAADPNYAPAYAGLASSYFILGNNIYLPPAVAYPEARKLAQKALSLDAEITAAYYVLASIRMDYDWDLVGAEKELREVIEREPSDAFTHQQFAFLLCSLGRHEEAIGEVLLARELDPLASRIKVNCGYLLYYARRYEEALAELAQAAEFDANHSVLYGITGDIYGEMGDYDKAISKLQKAISIEDGVLFSIWLAFYHARAGQTDASRALLEKIHARSRHEFVSPASLAAVYGALRENDTAFDLLERACVDRDNKILYLNVEPQFDPLRSDPRFNILLKKIGLIK